MKLESLYNLKYYSSADMILITNLFPKGAAEPLKSGEGGSAALSARESDNFVATASSSPL
jgi:hypothetical protein